MGAEEDRDRRVVCSTCCCSDFSSDLDWPVRNISHTHVGALPTPA